MPPVTLQALKSILTGHGKTLSRKKRGKKNTITKLVEYAIASFIIFITQAVPLRVVKAVSNLLGGLLYLLSKKRRNIAIENLRHAFRGEKSEEEIKRIARQSCGSFFLTFLEIIKMRQFHGISDAGTALKGTIENLEQLLLKAKKIHDESGGCIFVTPHIGSWEMLPHLSSAVGIPLVFVARPLDNEYLEKLLFKNRTSTGQVIIPKKNALYALQKTLQQGKSVGLLPDQSTKKGLLINFFGRKATTTPVPALLAVSYKKPVVAVACCRKPGDYQYDIFVSDPVYPQESANRKDEIIRMTQEMNRNIEGIIRKYPEQYLWIHNRWKTYKDKKEFLSN